VLNCLYSDKTLWSEFKTAFTTAFTDTVKKEDAYNKLKNLRIKENNLDTYIITFNLLARKAGWDLDNKGTIDAFYIGLQLGIPATRENTPLA
jgi:Retrotransposon gag protein